MRQQFNSFQAKGVQLVAVGMGDPAQARSFKASRGLPFPLLSDTTQRAYLAMGLGGVNPVAEMQGGTVGALFRESLKGNLGGLPVGDISQLGGTFLIDQQGLARLVHRNRTSADDPAVATLLKAVEQLAASKQS